VSAVKITISIDLDARERRALEKELYAADGRLLSSDAASMWAEAVVHEALSDVVWQRLDRAAKTYALRKLEGGAS